MKRSLGARTLVYPTPTWIVGTYDKDGKPNGATIAWGGICSSKPPCVAVALRKATYTFDGLMERRAFTVNVPSEEQIRQADYFGMVSGRDVDKFSATRLTPVRSELVDAPFIGEFPLVLECRVIEVFELGLHTQFVGEILDVKAEESVLGLDGLPEIEKVRPILFAPEKQAYYGVGQNLGQAFRIGEGF
ncbi:MAG: flavin reductase family protein [Thermoguttaceae bacterium]|jgi:flavin reductase (DIM6/NTAB) family NADH-FMN oxidoreductase RutF